VVWSPKRKVSASISDLIDRDHVVAVDLNSLDAGANRLLRESFRGAFAFPRRRNRPTIVVDHDDDRRFPYARHVQRLVKGAIAGPAVPDETDRDPIFFTQKESVGGSNRMRDLRADGNANGKVRARNREIASALVAAPIKQIFNHGHSAQQLRRVVAIGRHEHVTRQHGGRDSDADRFLAERGRKSPQFSGALQRDRLAIENARSHHGAVEALQQIRVPRDRSSRFV
jgi:hypothetical protein